MNLVERIVALHEALERAALPHAFGGALALAWCTERARGTIDIDCNVFVDVERLDEVLAALPVEPDDAARAALRVDGQARIWWDTTPIDVFLDTTDFHRQVGERIRYRPFAGRDAMPFLACSDLAVFKAFFDRTKDWADLEEMHAAGTLDPDRVLGVLVRYLGAGDPRVDRLARLVNGEAPPPSPTR